MAERFPFPPRPPTPFNLNQQLDATRNLVLEVLEALDLNHPSNSEVLDAIVVAMTQIEDRIFERNPENGRLIPVFPLNAPNQARLPGPWLMDVDFWAVFFADPMPRDLDQEWRLMGDEAGQLTYPMAAFLNQLIQMVAYQNRLRDLLRRVQANIRSRVTLPTFRERPMARDDFYRHFGLNATVFEESGLPGQEPLLQPVLDRRFNRILSDQMAQDMRFGQRPTLSGVVDRAHRRQRMSPLPPAGPPFTVELQQLERELILRIVMIFRIIWRLTRLWQNDPDVDIQGLDPLYYQLQPRLN